MHKICGANCQLLIMYIFVCKITLGCEVRVFLCPFHSYDFGINLYRKVITMVEVRFPASGLSAEYGDIVVSSVAVSLVVEVRHAGQLVLSERYVPDPVAWLR